MARGIPYGVRSLFDCDAAGVNSLDRHFPQLPSADAPAADAQRLKPLGFPKQPIQKNAQPHAGVLLPDETIVYGIDNWNSWISNQAKKKISIYNEIRAESMLQTYGSNASVEDAVRSTSGIVSQNEGGVKKKYSREMDTVEGMDRDSDGNALSDEQQEFFRDSKVRDDEGTLRFS